jgi:hypothetical protein
MYTAFFGDQEFTCAVEAIRLTWDGPSQSNVARAELPLRLSRLFDTPALGFSFDFDFRGDECTMTVFISREQTSPPGPMPMSAGQLLMLDRLPAFTVETPLDRVTFDRWAANDRQEAARIAIRSFATQSSVNQEAVLPWLKAIVGATRTATAASVPVRIILSARPCTATPAAAAYVSAIASDPRLSERLPIDLLRLLRKRVSALPELAFIIEIAVIVSSSDDVATLNRCYRDALSQDIGLPNASTLESIGAPSAVVSALMLHPTYFQPNSWPEKELLSRGVSRRELVSAISELVLEADAAFRNQTPSSDLSDGDLKTVDTEHATIRPRPDKRYYGLPLPSRNREKFVFVSYRQSNILELSKVLEHLHESGFNFWYDRGIPLAEEWDREIENQINDCMAFVGVLSNSYFASKICRRELKFADCIGKRIIVVACEPLKPAGGLGLMLSSLQVGFLHDPMIRTFIGNALDSTADSAS